MDNIKIAKQLLKVAKMLLAEDGFDFLNNNKFGPDNTIEVAKSDVFAYQLTYKDAENIKDPKALEGEYGDVKAGSWVCTAKVGKDAGEFWIVKNEKFKKNYDASKPVDSETMKKSTWGLNITFAHYIAASETTFECFRLPTDMKATTWQGNKFNPGNYVFIENGECDKWERTDKFMQQQYHKVGDGKKPSQKVYEQYEEIIGGSEK